MQDLDPHQRPPEGVRKVYKKYQRSARSPKDLDLDPDIVDLSSDPQADVKSKLRVVETWEPTRLTASFRAFIGAEGELSMQHQTSPTRVYEHVDMPGLHVIPSLLPPEIQRALLSRLLHRDLSRPSHLTNIHTHYKIAYPPPDSSFFSLSPALEDPVAHPINPSVHRPLRIEQFLDRKMRWMTLGGQYDWTQKRYPESTPPSFPQDIKQLLESIFGNTKAEAAIVNLYSPGDTLSIHRDVAESSATGLISISLGCDALFVIEPENIVTFRLRSGDAVYMTGDARFAWHGVPQVVPGTCPAYLTSWPASASNSDGAYEEWRGWMAGKRVNLNVRQMRD